MMFGNTATVKKDPQKHRTKPATFVRSTWQRIGASNFTQPFGSMIGTGTHHISFACTQPLFLRWFQRNKQTNKQTNKGTNKQTNKQTKKQTKKQTNKQTKKQNKQLTPRSSQILVFFSPFLTLVFGPKKPRKPWQNQPPQKKPSESRPVDWRLLRAWERGLASVVHD